MIAKVIVTNGTLEIVGSTGFNEEYCNSVEFRQNLDQLGILSGIAQELKGPITTYEKLLQSADQSLLLFFEEDSTRFELVGYLKYGYKNLFFYLRNGSMKQFERALCLLDFYVLESYQRKGIGKRLFDAFLEHEHVSPNLVAYDRPSPKLLPFLQRHYQLSRPDHQPNRYTIYEGFLS